MGFLMLYLSSKIDDLAKDKEFITAGDDNICIFAAHQDDGVIMAGGCLEKQSHVTPTRILCSRG